MKKTLVIASLIAASTLLSGNKQVDAQFEDGTDRYIAKFTTHIMGYGHVMLIKDRKYTNVCFLVPYPPEQPGVGFTRAPC